MTVRVKFRSEGIPGRYIWCPPADVARAFTGSAHMCAGIYGIGSGVGDIVDGECIIDFAEFTQLAATAVHGFSASDQGILRSLTLGFIPTSLVLIERSGHPAPMMPGPDQERAWTALRDQHAQVMPV
ncbi:DUF6086 family protein [Streptomyces sp. NPDC001406]|uniref:DUF6086 family protein n=1 Tax=Streptomyces sp. NPDC001406 TaxID=3364572 RepID=UPI0036C0FEFE